MGRCWIALWVALALAACETTSKHSFVSEPPTSGPDGAVGAVVWLHGWCPGWEDCSAMGTPSHVRRFGAVGWDVYRVNIPPSHANHDNAGWYSRSRLYAELALLNVTKLRAQGYQRIALAGYSGGAMGALFAGTLTNSIDAVFAMAPCCGVNPNGPYVKVRGFYDLLDDFKAPRLMIFFFSGERNAPGDIGSRSTAILGKKDVVYRVYDEPEGFHGHSAGLTAKFAKTFGDEIISFATGEE